MLIGRYTGPVPMQAPAPFLTRLTSVRLDYEGIPPVPRRPPAYLRDVLSRAERGEHIP